MSKVFCGKGFLLNSTDFSLLFKKERRYNGGRKRKEVMSIIGAVKFQVCGQNFYQMRLIRETDG